MRDEIVIPSCAGAEIFVNNGGGITIRQQGADDEIIALTVREARLVADALREVADFLDANEGGANG